MADQGYSRTLTFTVNDKQIKKATDKLFQSLDKIEKKIDQVVGKYNREVQVTYSASERVTKSVNTQLVAWRAVKDTAKVVGGLIMFVGTAIDAATKGLKGMVEWWKSANETIGQTLERQKTPLNELNGFVSKLRSEMEGYHSSTQKAKNAALELASVIKVQVKEQAALNNLVNQGLGPIASGMRGRLPKDPETGKTRPGSRNRAFGRRYVGTPDEEAAKMRNRAINERRSRAIDARFWRMKNANQKIEKASATELLRLETERTNQIQTQINSRLRGDPTAYAPGAVGPRQSMFNRLGFGKAANPQGAFANSRGRGGRISGAVSSGMIGGGFPFLFGQGGLSALGGGIGGVAGGALGGGFGFGLSIVGTALATAAQDAINFQNSIDKVNNSIRQTGSESLITAKGVKNLATRLDMTKEEVLEASAAFAQFGGNARLALTSTFGKNPENFYGLAEANDAVKVLEQINKLRKEDNGLSDEKARKVLEILNIEGAIAARIELRRRSEERAVELENLRKVKNKDILRATIAASGPQSISNEKADPLYYGRERVRLKKLEWEETDRLIEKEREWVQVQEHSLFIAQTRSEIQKLMDPLYQLRELSVSVGNSFAESFKGIVSGSMTAQQALANLFQRTADHFLDMAAQMIAKQIQMKILGIGLDFFGNSKLWSNNNVNPLPVLDRVTGNPGPRTPPVLPRAFGGPVKGGSPYVVGEKGPELFVPGSSGNIVPNHAMGGANIVVNVDASGSSVEGDAERSRQLGDLIGAAVQSEIIRQQRPGGTLF